MKFILTISLSLFTFLSYSQEKAKAKVKLSEKQKTEQRVLKKRNDSKVTRSTTLKNAAMLKNNPKAKRMQDYLNTNSKKRRANQTGKRDDSRVGTRAKRPTKPMKNLSDLKKRDMKKYPGVEWKPAEKRTQDEKASEKSLK